MSKKIALYPSTPCFVLICRTSWARGDDAFKVMAVYTDEHQVQAKVNELNAGASDERVRYFYYAGAPMIDPRQGEVPEQGTPGS